MTQVDPRTEPHKETPPPPVKGKWRLYISEPSNQVAVATLVLVVLTFLTAVFAAYVTRDQEHTQLRAYVGPQNADKMLNYVCPDCALPASMGDVGDRDSLTITFKNFGATPAYRPDNCIEPIAVPINQDIDPKVALEKLKTCRPIRRRTIWPGEDPAYRFAFKEDTVDMFRHVNLQQFAPYSPYNLYIVGFLTYNDIFGKPHKTYITLKYLYLNGQHWFEDNGSEIAADY